MNPLLVIIIGTAAVLAAYGCCVLVFTIQRSAARREASAARGKRDDELLANVRRASKATRAAWLTDDGNTENGGT